MLNILQSPYLLDFQDTLRGGGRVIFDFIVMFSYSYPSRAKCDCGNAYPLGRSVMSCSGAWIMTFWSLAIERGDITEVGSAAWFKVFQDGSLARFLPRYHKSDFNILASLWP